MLLGLTEQAEIGWLLEQQRKAGFPLSGCHYGPSGVLNGTELGSLGSSLCCHLVGREKDIHLNLEIRQMENVDW